MNSIYLLSTSITITALIASHTSTLAQDLPDVIDHTEHSHHNHREDLWDHNRVDSSAPIGIMGEHTHHKGGGMLSYRYMRMDMRPNYIGESQLTPQQVLATGFKIAPLNMQTEMQMIGGMYAPSDELTLLFMVPRLDKSMQHLVANGTQFTTKSNGIGDFKFGGLLKFFDRNHQRAHLNLMLSAPTGSTTERGFVPPAGGVIRLPYPMQLGTGTWDISPGITYIGQTGDLSWGSQLLGTIRLGSNSQGYSFGNGLTLDTWIAYRLCDSMSTSFRVSGKSRGNIDGRDALIGGPVPTADPELRGGSSIDVFGGINYKFEQGILQGHQIAFEAGNRIYQNLDGPQLGTDWMFLIGWKKEF